VPSRFLFEARGEAPPAGWVGIEASVLADEDEESPRGRGKKKAKPKLGRPAARKRKTP
jgi:hypothetical protein